MVQTVVVSSGKKTLIHYIELSEILRELYGEKRLIQSHSFSISTSIRDGDFADFSAFADFFGGQQMQDFEWAHINYTKLHLILT